MTRHGPRPASLPEAVHIVHGLWHPDDARNVVHLYDSLNQGPCHPDPQTHDTLRREYWRAFQRDIAVDSNLGPLKRGEPGTDERAPGIRTSQEVAAALAAYPNATPIVLWTSPDPGDRLASWWVIDGLLRAGIATARCWVAETQQSEDGPAGRSCRSQPLERIREALGRISPLAWARARRWAALWEKFAGDSTVPLDRLRRTGAVEAADAEVVSALLCWGLPRVTGRRGVPLRLSEFDQSLLGCLGTRRWTRPVDVLVGARGVHPAMDFYGDRIFSRRFREWACHRPEEPSVISRPLLDGANALTRVAYRLTPKGRRIVEAGLDDPADAPDFHVGGCRSYGGTPVWARRIAGGVWRVVQWG